MKKFLGVFLILMLSVFPFTLKAVTANDEKIDITKYKTMNFKEILAEEQITEEFTNYSENDDQAVIYMFRGNGCGYCRSFLSFLNSITEEYGKYFKVVGFEVWYDSNNSDLLKKVSTFMGENAGGVPYIIIGSEVFPGYTESYNTSIKNAITELYNSKDKYDVFKEYNKAIDTAKKELNGGTTTVILWNFIFVFAACLLVMSYVKKQNKKLLEELTKRFEEKPVKEEKNTKKVTKKKNDKKKEK